MASTPPTIDLTSREAFAGPSELSNALPNAFSQMMQAKPAVQKKQVRDRCRRLEPTYNFNYNPFKAPRDDLPLGRQS